MKRQYLNINDVRDALFDELGNDRHAFEVKVYEKNALGRWNLAESSNTLGRHYVVLPDSNGDQQLYSRAGDTLIPLNSDFNDPTCGRCYVIGDELPVTHKITGNAILANLQSKYGETYSLRRQDYSDQSSFFYFADPSGSFRVNHGGHDVSKLLDHLMSSFQRDPAIFHGLERISGCIQDNTLMPEYHEWTHLETLVGESISRKEFEMLTSLCSMPVLSVTAEDNAYVESIRNNLENIRSDADELEYITPRVKVEWVNMDEGWNGDYNSDDPADQNLLRFDVSILRDGAWEGKEDASYCTQFPATATFAEKQAGLVKLSREYADALSSDLDVSVKKLGERLSWISLDDVRPTPSLQNEISALAADLNHFSEKYDTYEYKDQVEDIEAFIAEIENLLSAGDTFALRSYLAEFIAESNDVDAVKEAQLLWTRVNDLPEAPAPKPSLDAQISSATTKSAVQQSPQQKSISEPER